MKYFADVDFFLLHVYIYDGGLLYSYLQKSFTIEKEKNIVNEYVPIILKKS